MVVWRITARKFADTAFNGVGASLFGGRWNPKGTPLVYCTGSASLAAWEFFVGVSDDLLPRGLVRSQRYEVSTK